MMKRHFLILVSLFASIFGIHAQELSVQSFTLAETDITANTPGTMVHDQNGNVCALIKVETTQKGFTFDVGVLGVVSVVEQPAEIWVYVPFGIRKITIQHPQLGILRDYPIPCAVEKGKAYIMKLISGSMRTVVEEVQTKQFLCIEVEPSDAFLELNGKVKFLDNGVYQELLPFGRYEYKVTAENYHEQTGVVNLNDPENASRITLSLKPAFGHVSVLQDSQSDIQGASVYIDNKLVGKIPVRDVQMSSGTHRIRVMAEMYEVYDDTFVVSDEEKKVLSPVLTPAYADVILNTADGAEIFVNGELKGASSWNGRLASGSYMIETRKSGHVPYKASYDITAKDQSKVIQIQGPTPIYGSLAISSTPVGAKISINGKPAGTTPKYIPKQVIGGYSVTLELDGYLKQTKSVTVTEGHESSLAFALENVPPKSVVEIPDYVEVTEDVVEDEAIPFQLVDVKASFQGGDANQFSKWVNQRLVYPEIAKENGVQGRVTLQFTVDKDGSVKNVKVLRGVDPALDKEAVRVVSMSPKWTPGKQRDRVVPVIYTFPVIFQLR